MVEIISYKMCAAKVRNAKLRNYLKPGLVTWPFCGQITRFWLFYFLFGLEKNVWPFGSILAFLSSDRNFHYFLV